MHLFKAGLALGALLLGFRVGIDLARKYMTPSGA
jgi:hypothetical protein